MGRSDSEDDVQHCAETKCKADLKKKAALSIYCDICENLYCNKCMNIPGKSFFDMITDCENVKMACNKCLKFSFTSLCKNKKKEETLTKSMEELQKKIDDIKSVEENIEKEIKKQLSYSKVLQQNLEENLNSETKVKGSDLKEVSDILSKTIKEDRQIKEKNDSIERSIIIQGITEANIKKYDERLTSEMEKIEKLITDGIKIPMPKIERIQRIGKFNENPRENTNRAIKVIFMDKLDRDKILRNKSNLKEADIMYKTCYINRDLTANERKEYGNKLAEAKEENKKEENKGKFFVVRGHPSKWKIVERVRRAED